MSKIKFHHLKPTPGTTKSKIRRGRGEADRVITRQVEQG